MQLRNIFSSKFLMKEKLFMIYLHLIEGIYLLNRDKRILCLKLYDQEVIIGHFA